MVAGVEWQAEIDEDGRFDNGDEDEGEGEATGDDGDNNENSDNGNGVDHLKIVGGKTNHILSEAGFADEESGIVILFDDASDVVNLSGHFVGGGFVFGDGEGEFVSVGFGEIGDRFWQDFGGDLVTDDLFEVEDGFDAGYLTEFVIHLDDFVGCEIGIG